jgi:IS5 family transposase
MTILPDFLRTSITSHLATLQAWFSEQVYEHLQTINRQHILVQIHQHFDLGPLELACRDYHHQAGPGTSITHPVPKLLRALLIKHLYAFSFQQTEVEISNNMLFRWFVGLTLFEPVCDHTTLYRFEAWLLEHQPRLWFDAVLRQIDGDFPEQRPLVQIGDTFAMRANAAVEPQVGLLRHLGERLLRDLHKESPEQYHRVMTGLDLGGLLGAPDERPQFYLDEAAKGQRLMTTTLALIDLRERVLQSGSLEALPRVQLRLEEIARTLATDIEIHRDARGQVAWVEQVRKKVAGLYRLGSATDPEASYRTHGESLILGYNISLAATPDAIIREIQAASGAQVDQACVAPLLQTQAEHGYPLPSQLVFDQAAGAGKTRAEVERVSQGQTQLVAKIHSTAQEGRFGPQDFRLSEDQQSLTCPQQISTLARYRSSNRDAYIYYFTAAQCQGCPFWAQCRDPKVKASAERRVFISDYHEVVAAAQRYNQTPDFRKAMRLRPRIERIIFVLTHYDGARRAQSRGLAQADFQAKMSATVRNLRTWMKLRQKRELLPAVLPGQECAG